MSAPALLRFQNVSKRFGSVTVLNGVTLDLAVGSVMGLVGENGAGKSTLLNILGGNLQPEEGRMEFNRRLYAPRGPAHAARAGIAFVHQELNLFPNLSIAENLFLTDFPTRLAGCWIDRRTVRRRAAELLQEVGLSLSPDLPVERLSAGERQLVEVARALGQEAKLILLDEPTTSLSARECERLFALIARLRDRGVAVIYISHALGDVLRLCDRVVVLRDGEVVGAGPTGEFSMDRLVTLMVGRTLQQLFPVRQAGPRPEVLFSVHALSQPGVVEGISFDLHAGEILGCFGLMGAGRSELARLLFGLEQPAAGVIQMEGKTLAAGRPRRRIQEGLAFVTEDRRQEGLCLAATIAENLALVSLPRHARGVVRSIDRPGLNQALQSIRQAVRLTATAQDDQPVWTLSGGNQQKVVLAKWLLNSPRVFLLDEPTRGIDVGAKQEVYQLVQRLADDGAGVLLISSELEELLGLCDRIVVMSHGELRDCATRGEFDRERLLRSALRDSGGREA